MSPVTELNCKAAQAWVASLGGKIPSTLHELRKYSLPLRRAIYQALPLETRRDLWRDQLTYYLREGGFDAERRAFIESVLHVTLESHFGSNAEDLEEHKVMGARAKDLFGFDQAKQIFVVLGSTIEHVVAGPTDPIAATTRTTNPATTAPTATAAAEQSGGSCSCNKGADWCNPAGLGCNNPPEGCTATQQGCGWLWCEPCDGHCNV